jgi:uncharacterized protein YkwD
MMLAALLLSQHAHAEPLGDVLAQHSAWREAEGVPALRVDADLAQSAQQRAEKLATSGTLAAAPEVIGQRLGSLVVVGENVSTARSPEAAAARWLDEQVACEGAGCSHYAAAVAPYALAVGCGWAEPVLVCRYGSP